MKALLSDGIRPVVLIATIGIAGSITAAELKQATVTQIVKDVQLLSGQATLRPASLNENVGEGTTVLTGGDSRAEVTFKDQTVARLGASSIFSFKNGTRDLNLAEGAVLLQVPKSVKGAKIHAPGVTAAITGTTGLFEYHPGVYKFLVLDGTGRLYRPGHLGDSVLVRSGQMVFGKPNAAVSDPVDFDIGRFVKTSRFIIDFPPLRSETLMAFESRKQQQQKSKKILIDTNLVIFGGGTLVSLVDPRQVGAIGGGTPATPTPMSSATSASADLGTIETSSRPAPSPASTATTGAIAVTTEQVSE